MLPNASLYAELSELAYSDALQTPGYKSHFLSVGSTQCHVLISESDQIVVFRGTEKKLEDLITDLRVKQLGGIHKGFLKAYQQIISSVYNLIDSRRKITFTGHSLGGALAILACCMHGHSDARAITFGAPRVFDRAMARHFKQKKIVRYENAGDPVPFVPFYYWGYRHIGDCYYITEDLNYQINPNPIESFLDMFFSSIEQKKNSHSIKTYKEKIQRTPHV